MTKELRERIFKRFGHLEDYEKILELFEEVFSEGIDLGCDISSVY